MTRLFLWSTAFTSVSIIFLLGLVLGISRLLPESSLLYITQPRSDQRSTLYLHSLSTQVRYPLFELFGWGADAAWSPDGNRIAYTTFQENLVWRVLYIYDLKTLTTKMLDTRLADVNSPSWSPDGSLLVFQGVEVLSNWDIYLYDLAENEVSALYEHNGSDGRPAWSPDGEKIIFESQFYSLSNSDVVELNILTGEVTALTSGFTISISPVWSPNGTQIAFTAMTEHGTYSLFTMQADGSDLFRFPDFPGGVFDPAWSADGKWIAFSGRGINDADHLQVYIVSSDGKGTPRRMTYGNDGYLQPHWRP